MSASHANAALEARSGLPVDQLFLSRKYPRADWPAHSGLGDTAKTWLGVHRFFRIRSAEVAKRIETVRSGKLDAEEAAPAFRSGINEILSHLEMHHQIEDHHFFPQFQRIEPRLTAGFQIMDADHHLIHTAIHGLSENTRAFLNATSQSKSDRSEIDRTTNELGDALTRFRRNMLQHLDDEEDLVIPLILDRNIL